MCLGASGTKPVLRGTYTSPSNSNALFTPSHPYIRFVAALPEKLHLTNSYRPLGEIVIWVSAPERVIVAPSLVVAAPAMKLPGVGEVMMNAPVALPVHPV